MFASEQYMVNIVEIESSVA